MRGLILLIRRPVCRTALDFKKTSQEPLRFNSSASPQSVSNLLRRPARGNSHRLPDGPCRTRFAPSPTGYLHLGSLRTALYNYLLAKATGGQFVLRIEDTDRTRLVPDAEERLYKDLAWAGLTWDEGPNISAPGGGPYGPYRQSERLPLYDEHADQLIREGKAYRCFCSREDLEHQKREAHARGERTHYQGTCRSISSRESEARAANGESFAVRFKSGEEPMMIHDMVYGRYRKAEREEDFIIRKQDGFPTYHFANVVDDRLMQITHVIRGAEWLISTPKHVEMYDAFGWEPPAFSHVGLLVDVNRHKLSKRDLGVDMAWYKDQHVLPNTLLNFAVLLGWGRPSSVKSDVMTLEQMVDNFLPKFSKGDIVVDLGKLPHLQTKHLREMLNQQNPDPRVLSQLKTITEPIVGIINHIQEIKTTQVQKQQTTAPTKVKKQDKGNIMIAQTAQRVGELLPKPASLFPKYQKDPSANALSARYVSDVLRANNGLPNPLDHTALARFVSENWFLFFTVPESTLHVENLSCKSALLTNYIQGSPVNAQQAIAHLEDLSAALSSSISESTPESEVYTVVDQAVRSCLPTATTDKVVSGEKPSDPVKLFWHVVRWALTSVDVGPSVSKIVQILGKDETLRRLELAKRGMVRVLEDLVEGKEEEKTG